MIRSRRDFLLLSLAACSARAEEAGFPIIDTHTHFYDPTRPQGVPWPSPEEKVLYRTVLPKEFKALVKPHGVTGTVVVEASPWLEDNQWVLDIARDEPAIVGLVGSLTPGTPEFRVQLKRFAANQLFLGIRLRDQKIQVEDAAWLEDMRRMAGAGRSLDLVGDEALLAPALALAKAIPELRIIIDHLPFEKVTEEDWAKLAAAKNLYVKVSHVLRKKEGKLIEDHEFYRPKLEMIWRVFGPDRVLYGSNWPVSSLFGPYDKVFEVVHSFVSKRGRQDTEKYFWKNSQSAYQWKSRS